MEPTFHMKSANRFFSDALLLTALMTLFLWSCKKDSASSAAATTVTVDVAADAVTEAITPESAGMVMQTETAVVIVNDNDLSCGVESDTSFSGTNVQGAAVTYSYALSSNRLLTCNNSVPSSFQFNFLGKSAYDTPRISSNDSSNAQFTVTGLEPGASQFLLNEKYVRNGSEASNVGNKASFSSTIIIQSSNIVVDKSTQQIVSGSASVNISGATSDGKSFSYSGTITFLGNKQATLVLGDGNSYSIVWS